VCCGLKYHLLCFKLHAKKFFGKTRQAFKICFICRKDISKTNPQLFKLLDKHRKETNSPESKKFSKKEHTARIKKAEWEEIERKGET
jgi:hypothetical protein